MSYVIISMEHVGHPQTERSSRDLCNHEICIYVFISNIFLMILYSQYILQYFVYYCIFLAFACKTLLHKNVVYYYLHFTLTKTM